MAVTLRTIEIQGQKPGPHLLISGGVHGDEFEPVAAIRRLGEMLTSDDLLTSQFQGRVTLVPCVNEPAFLLGKRCGPDGLDLARTCPGNAEGTITEQIAASLSDLIRSSDYYIDLHTGGTEFALYPLAGYVLHTDESVLDCQRRMAQAFNLNIVWGTSPELEGRSLSVARDAGVPAIYCEYFGAATCSKAGVQAYVEGCLNVMGTLGMIEERSPVNRVEQIVEDNRPASGHLQVNNPSPMDGYFEAAVKLGEPVSQGDLLGTVSSLIGDKTVPIISQQKGCVLMLRTFPRVLEGDSVGVVLESPD